MPHNFKITLLIPTLLLFSQLTYGQLLSEKETFTLADTLRGMLTPFRTCYDVHFYHLDITVEPEAKAIHGKVKIAYKVTQDFNSFQIDLFENLNITQISHQGNILDFKRKHNAVFIRFPEEQKKGTLGEIEVRYEGIPTEAKRAPWDGGFVWKTDSNGKPWIGVACQGVGASLWWPNKDHPSDEPDSVLISCTVPKDLICVSNGRLRNTTRLRSGQMRYDWFVGYPINNYNITLNIADYANFKDTFESKLDGHLLDLDYWVLPENLEKAKVHFEQVKPMMACFERFFGPFPYRNDSYKLVETPYLGMEHQTAIAYGNKYKTGYSGTDYSRIGLDFDYIIIHETGHEWWGNHVSCSDNADLWIHEGFCTYSEALYVECMFDYQTALRYVNAKKPGVRNREPIIGIYNLNKEGSGDMYSKGMLLLNTLRHVIDNDELWFSIIRGILDDLGGKPIHSAQLENYIAEKAGLKLQPFFDQYLRHAAIPVFSYKFEGKKKEPILVYNWKADVPEFNMPVKVTFDGKTYQWLTPSVTPQKKQLSKKEAKLFSLDQERFYIEVKAQGLNRGR